MLHDVGYNWHRFERLADFAEQAAEDDEDAFAQCSPARKLW